MRARAHEAESGPLPAVGGAVGAGARLVRDVLCDASSAPHLAAREGDVALLRALGACGAPLDTPDYRGYRPLALACCAPRHVESTAAASARLGAVRFLVEVARAPLNAAGEGEDATIYDRRRAFAGERTTPLHCAAITGNTRVLEYLIERGASLGACDADGRTALDRARDAQQHESVVLLHAACKEHFSL